jgi:hypothetical protein
VVRQPLLEDATQIPFVGQDGILRAGCFTRARLRRLPIGAQVNNLPHKQMCVFINFGGPQARKALLDSRGLVTAALILRGWSRITRHSGRLY